ncbi:MAG: A/G-specific adenine glycosylase [Chloroflexi bacterium]|nr:A/G-specific adenine glycosylase [Chloroflexota bacterium]
MSKITSRLLNWYQENKRTLPWRDHPDPYAVWVSEIMLQQTRVDTIIGYFQRWMEKFPSIEDLAAADEQDVLNLWEGLGYYSRARNLHKAAKLLLAEYGAQLPEDTKTLMKLPGIGRYTAAAVSSMAFGHDAAALDGNIRRVYARVFNVEEPLGTKDAENILWALAEDILPKGEAGDYNQALMDLGSAICTPRSPSCEKCPIKQDCEAYQLDIQEMRPVRKTKKAVPHHIHAGAVIVDEGKVLLAQRPQKGLLGGMWEFPNGRVEENPVKELASLIWEGYQVKIKVGNPIGEIDHAYTHFKVTEHVFLCELIQLSQKENLRWANLKELDDYPMGKIDREIAKRLQTSALSN